MQNPFRTDMEPIRARFAAEHPAASAVRMITERVNALPAEYANPPRVFLVGGFVRDAVRGGLATDIDLEVFGISPERLEAELHSLFPDQVFTQGKSFAILRVDLGSGNVLDVAIPRRDSKLGKGHRGFEITGDPGMSIEEAVTRRDFTMNAMLLDAATWELVDPLFGQLDAKAGILRAVDPVTFVEDPLRVYRAVQFAARFDATVDAETLELLKKMVADGALDELPAERVTDELKKLLLQAERPSIGFVLMRELGIVERAYPELNALIGTEQDAEWHPEGDVWTHTLMVIDEAAKIIHRNQATVSEKMSVMVGALCHDLGKPGTTEFIDGRIRSRGHEEAGREPARTLLARWTFGEDVLHAATISSAEHLKPVMLYKEREKGALSQEQYANAVRRLVRRIQPVSPDVLLAVSEADWGGRGLPDRSKGEFPAGIAFRKTLETLKQNGGLEPLVLGRDILLFGVRPGERVGEILRAIEDARDAGEVKTRDEALALARRLIAS